MKQLADERALLDLSLADEGQRSIIFCMASGYRSPWICTLAEAWSSSARSSEVRSRFADPKFSSRRSSRLVPGIGTIHGFCARSQESATWPTVAFLRSATLVTRLTRARLAPEPVPARSRFVPDRHG